MIIKKGTWVQIHSVILSPQQRASQIPEDTKKTPLTMWVKGYLTADAQKGAECEITTVTGRMVKGFLEEVEPAYTHDFGQYIPELDIIRRQVREKLEV